MQLDLQVYTTVVGLAAYGLSYIYSYLYGYLWLSECLRIAICMYNMSNLWLSVCLSIVFCIFIYGYLYVYLQLPVCISIAICMYIYSCVYVYTYCMYIHSYSVYLWISAACSSVPCYCCIYENVLDQLHAAETRAKTRAQTSKKNFLCIKP